MESWHGRTDGWEGVLEVRLAASGCAVVKLCW